MICNNKRWRWLAFIKITWIPNVKKIITETEIPRLAGGERDAAGAGPGLRGGETDWLSTTSTGRNKTCQQAFMLYKPTTWPTGEIRRYVIKLQVIWSLTYKLPVNSCPQFKILFYMKITLF